MDPASDLPSCQARQRENREATHPRCSSGMSQVATQALEARIHIKNNQGWRRVVLNFTPSWFAVTMGTGITSILLHNLPYNGHWLHWLSIILFCLNVVLFLTFLAISILRYTMFPGIFTAMIQHPAQSLFTGTFPMGLATIVNMVVFVCVPSWGHGAVTLAWTLWWIDVALSLASCFYLPFILIYVHKNDLSKMTAAWLLPIVAPIVAAASGGIVAEVLPNPQHASWTIITSYVLWGTGFPLAMVVLTIYFHRLTVHQLPPREVIVSVFLPLGPLGQGSFGLMQLGRCALEVFPKTGAFQIEEMGKLFYALGNLAALVIWGFGLVWFFFALASISRSKFPFNMGWWGFTFPIGVYAVSTCTLAKDLPSAFFKNLGTILSIAVVLLWLGIAVETTRRAYTGQIFFAPCVSAYEKDVAARMAEKQQESVDMDEPRSVRNGSSSVQSTAEVIPISSKITESNRPSISYHQLSAAGGIEFVTCSANRLNNHHQWQSPVGVIIGSDGRSTAHSANSSSQLRDKPVPCRASTT